MGRENLRNDAMQVSQETAIPEKHHASHCQIHACDGPNSASKRHRTLKATLGKDLRRLPTTWPVDASHAWPCSVGSALCSRLAHRLISNTWMTTGICALWL